MKIVPYKSRAEWLEGRKKGMGGSDVAAALGLSPWRTPVELWQDKRGEAEPQEESEAMHFGAILEDIVAQEFAKRTGAQVRTYPYTICDGEDDWMRANLDRVIATEDIVTKKDNLECILECKTANAFSAPLWGESQLDEIQAGKVVTEHRIPLYYETQVQWYLMLSQVEICYVAVLIGGNDFRVYEVHRNDEVIDAIKKKVETFWKENVLGGKAPDPMDIDDIRHLYRREVGPMVEASAEAAIAIGEYRNLKGQADLLKKQMDAVATQIAGFIGENEGLLLDGKKAVTFKAQSRATFDSKKLKADDPELWIKYVGQTAPSRVLRVY